MQIFSLEESMSKAHVFHRLCSLASSGTFLLSALGLEYDAKIVYKGSSWDSPDFMGSISHPTS